jgi:hypothetical protein
MLVADNFSGGKSILDAPEKVEMQMNSADRGESRGVARSKESADSAWYCGRDTVTSPAPQQRLRLFEADMLPSDRIMQ